VSHGVGAQISKFSLPFERERRLEDHPGLVVGRKAR
jgi:hypothetical protein